MSTTESGSLRDQRSDKVARHADDHRDIFNETETLSPASRVFEAKLGFLTFLGQIASINLSY